MSALRQKQTFTLRKVISASPRKADMCGATWDVRFVPEADIAGCYLPGEITLLATSYSSSARTIGSLLCPAELRDRYIIQLKRNL